MWCCVKLGTPKSPWKSQPQNNFRITVPAVKEDETKKTKIETFGKKRKNRNKSKNPNLIC